MRRTLLLFVFSLGLGGCSVSNDRQDAPHSEQPDAYEITSAAEPVFGENLTPLQILEAIEKYGADATVRILSAHDGGWEYFQLGVSVGDPAFLDIVELIKEGTDAGTSEGLAHSLREAFVVKPSAVLLRDFSFMSLEAYCENRMIEPTQQEWDSHNQRKMQAVLTIDAPDLMSLRDDCIGIIEETIAFGQTIEWVE